MPAADCEKDQMRLGIRAGCRDYSERGHRTRILSTSGAPGEDRGAAETSAAVASQMPRM